ncbi:hypothetical protein TJA_22310 [Thermus sp. LT1-2-5]|uniref:prepilin-type N-terminal cleavage/methylation domain-containing protein n=1 Tax=Thermus sp. LT1-2-5 TaxID=3026935 RepID=UPI0030E91F1D
MNPYRAHVLASSKGFSLVEVALALLLLAVLILIVNALSSTIQSGGGTQIAQDGLFVAETLLEEDASLANCPSTQSLTLGGKTYEVCQSSRSEALSTISREITTIKVYEGAQLLAEVTRVEVSPSSPPPIAGSCAPGNRRQVILSLPPTGNTYTAFSLSWSPNTPANQRLRQITQITPLPLILYFGNYASGSGFANLLWPLSLTANTQIRLQFSRNFSRNTTYTFSLRLRDALGREYTVSPCEVRW